MTSVPSRPARPVAPSCAPAAWGCPCGRSRRRPGSRRWRHARRRPDRNLRRWTAAAASRSRWRDSRRWTCCSSTACRGGQPPPAPCGPATADGRHHGGPADSGFRICPGSHSVTSTAAPGRLTTSTITPYTTAVATPWSAPSPAADAATPSRGPQPPIFVGIPMASRISNASGSSWPTEALVLGSASCDQDRAPYHRPPPAQTPGWRAIRRGCRRPPFG